MIRFACPGCNATFTVGDEKAGKTGKCPKCQSQFTIPEAGVGESSENENTAATPDTDTAGSPPPLPSPGHEPAVAPPPTADPNAAVEVAPCPSCKTRLSVLPSDLGLDVECPTCRTVFKAVLSDSPMPPPMSSSRGGGKSLEKVGSGSRSVRDEDDDDDRPSRKKRSSRYDDEDEDDRPSRRKRSSRYDDDDDDDRRSRRSGKPGNVQAVGIMLLAGGVYGVLWVLGFGGIYGIGSFGICCLWPGWWYELVWGILAIIRGANLIGQTPNRKSPLTFTIMQIICIVNGDIINCILGIVATVLINNPDSQKFYRSNQ